MSAGEGEGAEGADDTVAGMMPRCKELMHNLEAVKGKEYASRAAEVASAMASLGQVQGALCAGDFEIAHALMHALLPRAVAAFHRMSGVDIKDLTGMVNAIVDDRTDIERKLSGGRGG